MRLAPMFSYYGSKWRLSPAYPPPLHSVIIEPFAGSACYSLLHGAAAANPLFRPPEVHLYDKNEKVCMVWQYLIGASEYEIMALPLLRPDEQIPVSLPQEARYLLGFWTTKGSSTPSTKMAKTENNQFGHWSANIRRRVADQVKYIEHWTITHRCYSEIEDRTATWFIDPPYMVGGEHYVYSDIDYDRLRGWCLSRSGQVIVCENGSADWMQFRPLAKTKGFRRDSTESVWTRQ
jgi:hypothetical protein